MKNFRLLFGLLMTAVLLCSCGKAPAAAQSSAAGSAASSAQQEEILTFSLNDYDCQVTIPAVWSDFCQTETGSDGKSITFRSAGNADFGGTVFAIWRLTDEELAAPDCFDFCDGTPVLLDKDDSNGVSFYLVHPYTDVEYNSEDADLTAEYQAMLDGEQAVGQSFTWQRAEAQEPAPAASASSAGSWQDAYQAVLTETAGGDQDKLSMALYAVYDADQDGVPELFVETGTCEAHASFQMYRFADGSAAKCGTFSAGHAQLCSLSGKDGVLCMYAQMGNEVIDLYSFQNGVLSETPEELFNAEVKEYHDLTPVDTWELNDNSGLQWTANPSDSNWETVGSLAK